MIVRRALVGATVVAVALTGCARTGESATEEATPAQLETPDERLFPDVVQARTEPDGDGTFRISATVSSPYDGPDQYADAWRVLAPDGTVLGVRELLHPHADEQPFERSLDGVAIPTDVTEVTVEARDSVNGWGGATVTVPVQHG